MAQLNTPGSSYFLLRTIRVCIVLTTPSSATCSQLQLLLRTKVGVDLATIVDRRHQHAFPQRHRNCSNRGSVARAHRLSFCTSKPQHSFEACWSKQPRLPLPLRPSLPWPTACSCGQSHCWSFPKRLPAQLQRHTQRSRPCRSCKRRPHCLPTQRSVKTSF